MYIVTTEKRFVSLYRHFNLDAVVVQMVLFATNTINLSKNFLLVSILVRVEHYMASERKFIARKRPDVDIVQILNSFYLS